MELVAADDAAVVDSPFKSSASKYFDEDLFCLR